MSPAIDRLKDCIRLHRLGEAISGHQVAYVEAPIADLEAVLSSLDELVAEGKDAA